MSFELADGDLEIKIWDNETGSRFLLHLLSTNISAELKEDEIASAYELSRKLSEHALAISHMAGQRHGRSWSIPEVMDMYSQHPGEMNGVSGNTAINALWDYVYERGPAPGVTASPQIPTWKTVNVAKDKLLDGGDRALHALQ